LKALCVALGDITAVVDLDEYPQWLSRDEAFPMVGQPSSGPIMRNHLKPWNTLPWWKRMRDTEARATEGKLMGITGKRCRD
jgi:hypothetical protein